MLREEQLLSIVMQQELWIWFQLHFKEEVGVKQRSGEFTLPRMSLSINKLAKETSRHAGRRGLSGREKPADLQSKCQQVRKERLLCSTNFLTLVKRNSTKLLAVKFLLCKSVASRCEIDQTPCFQQRLCLFPPLPRGSAGFPAG